VHQPTALRPLYQQLTNLSAQYLTHEKRSVRICAARVLALTPAAVPRDVEGATSAPAWERLTDEVLGAAAHLLWRLDGLSPEGAPSAQGSLDTIAAYLRPVVCLPGAGRATMEQRMVSGEALLRQVESLFAVLEYAICGEYVGPGAVPVLKLISLAERLLMLDEMRLVKLAALSHASGLSPEVVVLIASRLHELALSVSFLPWYGAREDSACATCRWSRRSSCPCCRRPGTLRKVRWPGKKRKNRDRGILNL